VRRVEAVAGGGDRKDFRFDRADLLEIDLAFAFDNAVQLIGDPLVRRGDDGRDVIGRDVVARHRKVFPDRLVRPEQDVIFRPGVVRILLFFAHAADDDVGDSVELNLLSDGVAVGEQLLVHFEADDDYAAGFQVVLLIDQTSAINLDGPDVLMNGPYSAHLRGTGVESALGAHPPAHQFRRDVLEQFLFFLEGVNVVDVQADEFAGPLAAGLRAGAPVADNDDVFAELLQHVHIALLKASAQRGEQHDRDHAPDDAEHRQEAAQLVRHQVGPGLCKQFTHRASLGSM